MLVNYCDERELDLDGIEYVVKISVARCVASISYQDFGSLIVV